MAGTPSDTDASRQLHATPSSAHRLVHFYHHELRNVGRRKNAVIEASLSPVKYATFAALGGISLRWGGFLEDPKATPLSDAKCGFLGGIILVVLFLMRLLLTSKAEDHPPSTILRNQLTLIFKEVTYSAIAACVGLLTIGGTRQCLLSMAGAGAIGALVSFMILYLLLGMVLVIIWAALRCGAVYKRWWLFAT